MRARNRLRLLVPILLLLLLPLLLVWATASPTAAQGPAGTPTPKPGSAGAPQIKTGCSDGTQASGAKYRICMPEGLIFPAWNGDLVIYAHGYVTPSAPIAIPEDQMSLNGIPIADYFRIRGYAFAASSYSTNGLAIKEGIADSLDLIQVFTMLHGQPNRVLLGGVSEGGLVTALSLEQHPEAYAGGAALCGPVGDFAAQINYMADFRVIFDYFFPGLLPGTVIDIPPSLMDNYETLFQSTIVPAIQNPANAISVTQLFSVTQAAFDPLNYASTISTTVHDVLWYDVYGTSDAIAKLGGQPYDNHARVYSGSLDDARLNAMVPRYTADPAALNQIKSFYDTTGNLTHSIVTNHTTLDQQVPYWHEPLYRDKVARSGSLPRYDGLKVERYGHCMFELAEVNATFNLLLARLADPPPYTLLLPALLK